MWSPACDLGGSSAIISLSSLWHQICVKSCNIKYSRQCSHPGLPPADFSLSSGRSAAADDSPSLSPLCSSEAIVALQGTPPAATAAPLVAAEAFGQGHPPRLQPPAAVLQVGSQQPLWQRRSAAQLAVLACCRPHAADRGCLTSVHHLHTTSTTS